MQDGLKYLPGLRGGGAYSSTHLHAMLALKASVIFISICRPCFCAC